MSSVTTTAVLARQHLRQRRRFVFSLAAASALLALMIAALFESIGQSYDEVFESMPAALEGMIGGADFGTPEGFLQVELFSIVAPALAIAAAISVAASALPGIEQNGQMELLNASPLRRAELVTAAMVASSAAIIIVIAGLGVGILGGQVISNFTIAFSSVAAGCVSVGLLASAMGAVSLAAGALTGSRGAAVGTGAAVAIGGYAIDAFFPINNSLAPFARFSLWYPYGQNQAVVEGLDPAYAAVLGIVIVGATVVAYPAFERRDLRTS